MAKSYTKSKWTVIEGEEEKLFCLETKYMNQSHARVEELFRTKNEVKIIPAPFSEDFSLAFLVKGDDNLWELFLPEYVTAYKRFYMSQYHRIAKNIVSFDTLDYFILYKCVDDDGQKYWQCFSLLPENSPTLVSTSEGAEGVIQTRIRDIPKIHSDDLLFDFEFRKLSKNGYFKNVCGLTTGQKDILIVYSGSTLMNGFSVNMINSELFQGKVQIYYKNYVSINGNILYTIGGKSSKEYASIVPIEKVLKKSLLDKYLPKAGMAMLDKQGNIVEIKANFPEFNCLTEREFHREFNYEVDEVSFQKINTSAVKTFILKLTCWYKGVEVKEICFLNSLHFEV